MLYIRQGATHKVVIGPAVSVSEGFTPVTTLALNTADEAEVILHDNGTVVDISGYTFAAIATADGYYHLTLQSGISGTVGHMTVVINDDSLMLPLRADFTVLEEAIYDALFAASANAFAGAAGSTTLGTGAITAGVIADSSIDAATFAADVDAEILSYIVDDATRIDASDLNSKIDSLTFTVAGDVDVNVQTWGGTAISTPPAVNATQISGSATAADNAEVVFATDFATNYSTTLDQWTVRTTDITDITGVSALTAIQNAANSGCDSALVDVRLDELMAADSDIDGAAPPTVGSVFHELMSATAGSFTFNQATDSLEAIRDRGDSAWITATGFSTHSAADVWTSGTRTLTSAANITSTGGTTVPQTGDSFARLGAPAGASMSADIAAVKAETATIVADTNELQVDWTDGGRLDLIVDAILADTVVIGTPAGASLSIDVAAVKTDTAAILVDTAQIKADLPSRPTKNTALANFPFVMVDETDGFTAETGLTVTATRSIDGAAFAACANAVAEVSNGVYTIDLEASDLNGDTIVLKFAATGARTRLINIVTQP